SVCKTACDKHNLEFYPKYKKQCDDYFWNAHRGEARGVGGLFFDYLKPTETQTSEDWYNFVTEIGNSFLNGYLPIVEKRKNQSYTQAKRDWQEIRRGRYVEFNLIHDKGTLFGLKTNGRIESILMSLPPHVQWDYDHKPEKGSEEEKRTNQSYTQANRDRQEIRRGRYVQINLINDKGSHCGIKTSGRIESILISLPPHLQWVSDHKPKKGSEEEKLPQVLENPREW